MTNRGKKRGLALCLSLALLVGMLPTAALAGEGSPACANHPAHTAECGYSEGTPEIPCDKDCTATDESGAILHGSGCAYAPAVAATPCRHSCDLCAPQDKGNDCEADREDDLGHSGPAPGTSGQVGPKPDNTLTAPAPLAAPPITGTGYSFDPDTGKLTITSNEGTTNWRDASSGIDKTAVTSVEVQDGVTELGRSAFQDCTKLVQAVLPDSLKKIMLYAFNGCTELALDKLPEYVDEIGMGAFGGCTALALTKLPERVSKIEEKVFFKCAKITLTELPANITKIKAGAFYGCTELALTELPVHVNEIGDSAFNGCISMTSLTLSQTTAPTLELALSDNKSHAFDDIPGLVIYVPHEAAGYDTGGWAKYSDKIVSGAALSGLTISGGALDPAFYPALSSYSAAVPYSVGSVTVTPTAHASESVTVNGAAVASGAASAAISLTAGGDTSITVIVKNSEPDSRTYTIIVTRAGAIPVAGVTLDKTALALDINGAYTLRATVTPDNATDQSVYWTSSAPAVAAVDTGGKVTALSSGTAVIIVTTTDGGKTAACSVTVNRPTPSYSGGGDDGPDYYHRSLTDKPTGVKVEGDEIHESARLTVTVGALHKAGDAGCDLLRSAQAGGHLLGAWDVSLSRSFRGNVTVSLPVEGRNGQTLTVAHCIGGKLTLSDVKVSGGFAKVETDSLSPFAVLDGVYTLAELEALAEPGWENPFADVDEGDWFYDAVAYVHQKGLMVGVTETAFGPDGPVTRAQVWTVLARLDGAGVSGGAPWYAPAQSWAVRTGVSDGADPDGSVTREQLVTMLYRYAQNAGMDVSVGGDTNILSYDDAFTVSEWAIPAFQWACGAGIVSGTGDTALSPKAGATRAQLAAVLMRFLEHA